MSSTQDPVNTGDADPLYLAILDAVTDMPADQTGFCGRVSAVAAEAARQWFAGLVAERDQYRAHSMLLNTLAYQVAEALGDVRDGQPVEGDPQELITRLVAEHDEYRRLFDMQWRRMAEATERWRAEDPEARARILPDLGNLLQWLMGQIDVAQGALGAMSHTARPTQNDLDAARAAQR